MNTDAVGVIRGLIEQLEKTEQELATLKETVNQLVNASGNTADEESAEEEHDYRFCIAKPGDRYYSLWMTDYNKEYKNPIIVCDDNIDPDMFSDDDWYDIEHNISIFQNKQDAERYARHVNIDLTMYRLKCHYYENPAFVQSTGSVLYLAYYIDGDDCVHITYSQTGLPRNCTFLSTTVTESMLEWMKPILSECFGFKFDI